MNIDLPEHVREAIELLCTELSGRARILLFGSHARGTPRSGSDFDIGILSDSILDWTEFAALKTRAEDIGWPYSMDIVDLTRAPDAFRHLVLKEAIQLGVKDHDIIAVT